MFETGGPVFVGESAAAITAAPLRRSRVWIVDLQASVPLSPVGYRSLKFAFHPGDVTAEEGDRLDVNLRSSTTRTVPLLEDAARDFGLDLNRKEWQVFDIPLEDFGVLEDPITLVGFSSNLAGTVYVDDVRMP